MINSFQIKTTPKGVTAGRMPSQAKRRISRESEYHQRASIYQNVIDQYRFGYLCFCEQCQILKKAWKSTKRKSRTSRRILRGPHLMQLRG